MLVPPRINPLITCTEASALNCQSRYHAEPNARSQISCSTRNGPLVGLPSSVVGKRSEWAKIPRMHLSGRWRVLTKSIQRWRDPVDGTVYYIYLPITAAHRDRHPAFPSISVSSFLKTEARIRRPRHCQ
jgi:hypothetical protein